MKFRVGSHVALTRLYCAANSGMVGKVVGSVSHDWIVAVEFENFVHGHNCGEFHCKDGHGLFVPEEALKPYNKKLALSIKKLKES